MTSSKTKKSTVNKAGNYTKPTMRKALFNRIKAGGKGVPLDNGQQGKLRCQLSNTNQRVADISHDICKSING